MGSRINWCKYSPDDFRWVLEDVVDVREKSPNVSHTKPTPKVKRVIFNNPATIIFWTDNTKTVVQCQPCDTYDKETGFVMAYLKKLLGNDNTFNKEINKWVYKV